MRSCLRRARAGPRRLLRGIMGRHPPFGCENLGHVLRRCRIAGGTTCTHPAARRPGRRRSLRRGAAVLSCRRGENTANSGPGHSRGFEPASASPSVPVPNPCPKRPQRAAAAFRPTTTGLGDLPCPHRWRSSPSRGCATFVLQRERVAVPEGACRGSAKTRRLPLRHEQSELLLAAAGVCRARWVGRGLGRLRRPQ
jgi:hypothetical protein